MPQIGSCLDSQRFGINKVVLKLDEDQFKKIEQLKALKSHTSYLSKALIYTFFTRHTSSVISNDWILLYCLKKSNDYLGDDR